MKGVSPLGIPLDVFKEMPMFDTDGPTDRPNLILTLLATLIVILGPAVVFMVALS